MKTFKLIDKTAFNELVKGASSSRKTYVAALQGILQQAIYMQAYNGKADYANGAMKAVQARDKKHVTAFILAHAENIRAATSADKDASKSFFTKKGVKPLASDEAVAAGLSAVNALPNWDTWAKEAKAKTESGEYDFSAAFSRLLTTAGKSTIKADQSAIFHALTSFLDLIQAGKSLADVRAENDAAIANARLEAIAEINAA